MSMPNDLRSILCFDAIGHPEGIPATLFGGMPRELIDVLLLMSAKGGQNNPCPMARRKTLRAFALYWLLFVGDDAKAAWCTYSIAKTEAWIFSHSSVANLIGEMVKVGSAPALPQTNELHELRRAISQESEGDYRLRAWSERFTECDHDDERKPGESLRALSTNGTLIKRVLMWLQRAYISEKFPDFDPISDRAEDLPIDLDHIIPASIFGFDWRSRDSRLDLRRYPFLDSDNFRFGRGIIGNSLGNFRWVDASEDRSRGQGAYVPLDRDGDLVQNPEAWNKIISQGTGASLWSQNDVAQFQRLIDLRTLDLYETLLSESGIGELLAPV